ncbi:hypothetical protein MUDAN_IGPPGNFN_03618 [Lactiplantibacillus mudanjiangensis]|nr:hypothetical protein MUDAN_IGPPGNFN_03618 [Lactiplantibacillus mudanjiangensis]
MRSFLGLIVIGLLVGLADPKIFGSFVNRSKTVSYTHLRAHET